MAPNPTMSINLSRDGWSPTNSTFGDGLGVTSPAVGCYSEKWREAVRNLRNLVPGLGTTRKTYAFISGMILANAGSAGGHSQSIALMEHSHKVRQPFDPPRLVIYIAFLLERRS